MMGEHLVVCCPALKTLNLRMIALSVVMESRVGYGVYARTAADLHFDIPFRALLRCKGLQKFTLVCCGMIPWYLDQLDMPEEQA
jgi:hypothetical protein